MEAVYDVQGGGFSPKVFASLNSLPAPILRRWNINTNRLSSPQTYTRGDTDNHIILMRTNAHNHSGVLCVNKFQGDYDQMQIEKQVFISELL